MTQNQALSQQYYKNILDHANEALLVVNQEFEIQYCNRSFGSMLQVDVGALIGTDLHEHLDDGLKVLHYAYRHLTQGKLVCDYHVSIKPSGGKAFGAILSAHFLYSATGRRQGMIVTLDTRTMQSQAMVQLLHREKLAVIKYLANSLAHEIYNPVNILSGSMQLLKREAAEAHIKSFDIMDRQIGRIAAVIDQLRKFNHDREDSIPRVFGIIEFVSGFLHRNPRLHNVQFHLEYSDAVKDTLVQGNEKQSEDGFTYLLRTIDNIVPPATSMAIKCHRIDSAMQGSAFELGFDLSNTTVNEELFDSFSSLSHNRHSLLDAALAHTIFSNFGGRLFIDTDRPGEKILKLQFVIAGKPDRKHSPPGPKNSSTHLNSTDLP